MHFASFHWTGSGCYFFCFFLASIEANDDFDPDIRKLEGLICYQCESNASALLSLCDSEFFKTHKLHEKLDMIFQCPLELQEYCIKKTMLRGNTARTTRGCSSAYDSKNVTVRSGCVNVIENDNAAEICLCSRNLCNESSTSTFNCFLLLALLLSVK